MSHLTRPLFKLAVVALFCHIVTSCQPHGNTGQDSLSDGKPLIHVTGNNSGFKVVSTRRHGPEGGFPAAQMLPPGVDLKIKHPGSPATTVKILDLENSQNFDLNPATIKQWKNILTIDSSTNKAADWFNTQPNGSFSPSIQQVESFLAALRIR